jgi:hypothetical protein
MHVCGYVACHCDRRVFAFTSINGVTRCVLEILIICVVDKVYEGKGDSSLLYILACPVTEANTEYAICQRNDFLEGIPPPGFAGGKT